MDAPVLVEAQIALVPGGIVPTRGSLEAAGWDLYARVDSPVYIHPGRRSLIPVGFVLALPPGYEAQVRPRSGLALKSGLTVTNSPGTVDSDFRGEVAVILQNTDVTTYKVQPGDRIAQMVFQRVPEFTIKVVDSPDLLRKTKRDVDGYGSSGR